MMGMAGRGALPFRQVNRPAAPGYRSDLQRHHLIPVQFRTNWPFSTLLAAMEGCAPGFDDFRTNGMLLPCEETAVLRTGLPLHRGPHHHYSQLVAERLGSIEASWQRDRRERGAAAALVTARWRIRLLQDALRKRLLKTTRPITLNRRDPRVAAVDYSKLDAMVEALWQAT